MSEVLIGIKDRESGAEMKRVLGDLGYGAIITHTCRKVRNILDIPRSFYLDAVALDSQLIDESVEDAREVLRKVHERPGTFVIAYMMEESQDRVMREEVKQVISGCDYVEHAPPTPRGLYIAIRSLKRLGYTRLHSSGR